MAEEEIIPKDRYYFVYIVFYLLGIGNLMPWNFFINGKYKIQNTPYMKIILKSDFKMKDIYFISYSVFCSARLLGLQIPACP